MSASDDFEWNLDYLSGRVPWDVGQPSPKLKRLVEEGVVLPGRAFEMGCGTGTDAVFLARRGFSVVAADCSSIALARARMRAAEAGVEIQFLQADLCNFTDEIEPVDFVYDRSCYEFARLVDLSGYLRTLRRITRPGSKYLLLVRNAAAEHSAAGTPRVHSHEIVAEMGDDFAFDWHGSFELHCAQEQRFQRWSCLMTRRKVS